MAYAQSELTEQRLRNDRNVPGPSRVADGPEADVLAIRRLPTRFPKCR